LVFKRPAKLTNKLAFYKDVGNILDVEIV